MSGRFRTTPAFHAAVVVVLASLLVMLSGRASASVEWEILNINERLFLDQALNPDATAQARCYLSILRR